MKKINLLIMTAILLTSCRDPETPKPNITIKDNILLCESGCAHVQPMGCPEAQPLIYPGTTCISNAECLYGNCINGKCTETCEMVCEAFIKEGRQIGIECWQTITSCNQIESMCR
jgi:hypothetical protein